MLVVGELRHLLLDLVIDQTHVVELEFRIGIELINLVTIGAIGGGINHFLTFGMMTSVGDKEA
jgi:hypothetical protein